MPAEPTATAAAPGGWVVPDVSYVDPARRHCRLCGRPIARRYWALPTPGGPLAFCEPAHAERWLRRPQPDATPAPEQTTQPDPRR